MTACHNILIDPLPQTVMVCGREFAISSDFRTAMLFEMLMQDAAISLNEKAIRALRLWFADEIPKDVEEATSAMLWFYACGRPKNHGINDKSAEVGIHKRIYDFDADAALIYAAFLSQYGVDLQDVEYLHWWKFSAMFSGLSDDCEIMKIMAYRAADLRKIKNKAERARYAALQAKYALEDNKTPEEKVAAAGALFAGAVLGGVKHGRDQKAAH